MLATRVGPNASFVQRCPAAGAPHRAPQPMPKGEELALAPG